MQVAIITGASSGLGAEYIRQLQSSKKIDEFWVIARRRDKLEKLKEISRIPVRVFAMDITLKSSIEALKTTLDAEKPTISYLIVAAGCGKIGRTYDISLEDSDRMIDLNCRAAVDVTTICLPYLTKGSRVMEIASTAGFQPLPALNIYSASKAFLISYTKTLHHELLTRGIHVTAVCPYWITDTEFLSIARTTKAPFYKHTIGSSHKKSVVAWSLMDSTLNLWVSTPSPVSLIHRLLCWIVPDFIMVPFMELLCHI